MATRAHKTLIRKAARQDRRAVASSLEPGRRLTERDDNPALRAAMDRFHALAYPVTVRYEAGRLTVSCDLADL